MNRKFVLFGGETGTAVKLNDTWTFDPAKSEWKQTRPNPSPPSRFAHKLVWHDKLGALAMAGGSPESGKRLTDLWIYDTAADRWTEVKTATAPPPCGAATCYDASQDLLVLFNEKGQTWTCKIERVDAAK